MPESATGHPRGHPKEAKKKSHPAGSTKEFLKDFFDLGKPRTCKGKDERTKKCQHGIPGRYRGTWPTTDPSQPSGSSGGPSGGPGDAGGGDGGAGGGGVGASVTNSSVANSKEKTNMSTKFRREISIGKDHVAAPPKEMGSNPEELQQQFTEEAEHPVVVSESDVEIIDDGPSGEPSGEPSMGETPETAVEVGEEEVASGEEPREPSAMTFRTGDDEPSGEGEIPEVSEEEVEAVEEEPSASCGCPCASEEEIPEVAEEEVEFLGGEEEEPSRAGKASYACGPSGKTADPSSPSNGPEEEPSKVEEELKKDAEVKDDAAAELVEVITPIESLGEVDINEVELSLFGEDSENPHYTVMVKGEPVAKIALADQTMPQGQEEMFLNDDYPQAVLEGIERFGLQDTLNSVHARYYASKALEGTMASKMKEAAKSDLEAEAKRHVAKIKDDLSNVAALVIEASLKNYIVENPLRDALVQQIRRAGVDGDAAVDIVEDAFREAGAQYFSSILNKAEEWMGAPKEAMEHHVKEITGMNYRHPGYAKADAEDEIQDAVEPEEIPQISTASVPKNVPIRTSAAPVQTRTADAQDMTGNWEADKAAWKNRINLFGRVASKSLAASANKFNKK